jgi:hypothetical protein
MKMTTKKELLEGCLERYLQATRKQKQTILDELTAHTKMNRKSVIRSLKRMQFRDNSLASKKRGRKVIYGNDVTLALKDIWQASRELCAERLHPILPEYVKIFLRDNDWRHGDDTTALLLKMSLGTIKNRIKNFKTAGRKKRSQTTKPGNLNYLIPTRRGPWENPVPGYGEIDTVVHCGLSLSGDVAYTVNFTDIATMWGESSAQLNKGQARTIASIKSIMERLPFPLLGLDPDNGSEFINWQLKEWCDTLKIELTRSRPYRKNDNAHIEQKNYTSVRNFLGWQRIDTPRQIKLINQLYRGPLRLFINFFQPSMKCIKKEKIGSKYVRQYDKSQTPYQRVLARTEVSKESKDKLVKLYATLNPKKLNDEINSLLKQIFK